jgi:hypothetical protein
MNDNINHDNKNHYHINCFHIKQFALFNNNKKLIFKEFANFQDHVTQFLRIPRLLFFASVEFYSKQILLL